MAYAINVDRDLSVSADSLTDHPLSAMLVAHGQNAGGNGFSNITGVTFTAPPTTINKPSLPVDTRLLGPPDSNRTPSGILFIGPPKTYDVPPAHTPSRAVLLPSRFVQTRQSILAKLFGRIPRK